MLKWAGLGVALEGSVEDVIKSADVICGTVERDGPATLLESFLERGLIG
jgi:hydroxymethylpyrimidine pyrophosphatase-like HAD family hydrolase